MTLRIAMWSGPRNLSTAMMRSFGARADTVVSDEPFYGAYLQHTGIDAPMRDAIIASMDCDWHSVARTLSGPCAAPIWYQKQMTHHMTGPIAHDDLPGFAHAFLIRDPARVIASYALKRETVTAADLGVAKQVEIFEREADRLGRAPAVIDSADVLADPPRVLQALCGALGIGFDPAMLAWPPGRRASDGIWASHWYHRVIASTGFEAPPGTEVALPDAVQPVLAACLPGYHRLAAFKL